MKELIAIILPFDLRVFNFQKKMKGVKVWTIAIGVCFVIILFCHILNNISKDVFVAEFHWDSGIKLYLRENGTYKAIYTQLIYIGVEYGKYEVYENDVIIEELTFGGVSISDTLKYNADKLHFKLEEEYRTITEGEMQVEKNELFKN